MPRSPRKKNKVNNWFNRVIRETNPRKYYTDKLRLWIQVYAPAKSSLGEFKNAMILGLYHMEQKRTCLQFMHKVLQFKSEFKAILDHQLVNMRMINTETRSLSHDMAGLKSSYSFEIEGKSTRTDEMWKMMQVPMEVNVMPG